jgi:DNA-binding NarL/FixJ family response regulator
VVRVLIADDHRLFAEALEAILATGARIQVVGRAANGAEATREIAGAGGAAVLVLSGSAATDDIARAREAGASGYVTKDQIASELVRAILDVAPGQLP